MLTWACIFVASTSGFVAHAPRCAKSRAPRLASAKAVLSGLPDADEPLDFRKEINKLQVITEGLAVKTGALAEQQAAPGPAQLLSSELVVFSASFVLSAAAFDYVTQQLRDIVIALLRAGSDEFVTSFAYTLLVGMAAAIVWIWRFADQRWRVGEADLLELALTLTPPPPPGLTELLSAVELSDTLEVATGVCKTMGADHVTDLVGHEDHFVKALFLYYERQG